MPQYPLLQTKLCIPPVQHELVSRPRLIERLSAGLPRQSASLSAGRFACMPTLVSPFFGFLTGALLAAAGTAI